MDTDSAAVQPPLSDSSSRSSFAHRSHMKRPSSTFCIPQHPYSYPDSSTTSASSPTDGGRDDDYDDEQLRLQPMLKRRSLVHYRRPWTNAEQESLYVAVERYKLFGRWAEVKARMNLDRSTSEIEEEYNRLYAEIPDSEEEFYDNDEDEDEDEDDVMYNGEVLVDAQDSIRGARSTKSVTNSGTILSTPALTATSSAAQSTHSSQENLAGLFGMSKTEVCQQQDQQQGSYPQQDQYRLHVSPPLEAEDEYDEGYEDFEDHQHQQQPHQQQEQQANDSIFNQQHYPQQHTSQLSQPLQPPQQPQQQASNHHHHQRHSSTSSISRPARMVRVWTPEQSENLKNLVEVYFPGAYRINWVWVAAQMGNAFTRKQCKNKWEIMRRRMGTEDEINLLKRGYQEFGPSWGQIQEKYLPERSRGGISIMWDLLETREAELQQQGGGVLSGPGPGAVGNTHHSGGAMGIPMTMSGPGSSNRKSLSHHRRNSSMSSVKSGLRINVNKDSFGNSTHRQRTATADIDSMDLSSPTTALYTLTEEMTIGSSHSSPYAPPNRPSPYQHRKSASMSSTTSAGRYGHGRHGSDVSLNGEWSSERNMPMTWTEPLTRRLQDLVREHFPNQSKINWGIISSLMGTNPAVSKDQCKRRWYLISQPHNQQQYQVSSHQLEYRLQQHEPSEAMMAQR
ncbi:hypothetical protein FBU30_007887 [Linnemannia zychae]|nr:hypothetical protein FBU30_007887 [Linnemannia zychae]